MCLMIETLKKILPRCTIHTNGWFTIPLTKSWMIRIWQRMCYKRYFCTLVMLTVGALAVSADFRRAVYTMIQKFLPIEMQLTYQVDGEPLEWLPDGYSDHYVPDGFERDREQEFERAENFLHVYSSKESGEGYTVRCSIIQPGQQSSFDNEHTTYKNVKVGDADATLGTSVGESGDTVYILSWEQGGVSNTIMGNISRDEIVRIAENIF